MLAESVLSYHDCKQHQNSIYGLTVPRTRLMGSKRYFKAQDSNQQPVDKVLFLVFSLKSFSLVVSIFHLNYLLICRNWEISHTDLDLRLLLKLRDLAKLEAHSCKAIAGWSLSIILVLSQGDLSSLGGLYHSPRSKGIYRPPALELVLT